MIKPKIPADEDRRIQSLKSLDILDTPPEERFDRLTRLAKRMFNVPVAIVSLVDSERQFFKSKIGVEISETPRDVSFCAHTILTKQVFIVPDTTKDKRFMDNPLVTGPLNIQFYAGCPLHHLDGSSLGALCIMDEKARNFGDEELDALRDLAALVEAELMAIQLATQDELTKIHNRRGFISQAQNSLNICNREKISASLVYFDLDKFKQINDNWGHEEGDKTLITFANTMKSIFRQTDVLGRLGGDEFVVFLMSASRDVAEHTVERFRQSLRAISQTPENKQQIHFSEGIVTVEQGHSSSIENLLKSADTLMYEKKKLLSQSPQ
ncbi:MAG: sensor domain-containing diguanylate cyclase [Sneathiella sp.]|nr:sensor domain-containing diguanylate cyclase [Sneathiella sp.]